MLQKAGIEVNEKGTLAFAATGMRAAPTNADNLLNPNAQMSHEWI